MRIRSLGLFLVGLFLLVGAVPAQAQFNFTITTPFAFQVEDKHFPAGSYAFKQEDSDKKFSVTSQKRDVTGMFTATIASTEKIFEKPRTVLTFHRYGDKYFLSTIFTRHTEWQIDPSAEEKALQKSGAAMIETKLQVKM